MTQTDGADPTLSESTPELPAPVRPVQHRGGFWAGLLGGVAAAGIGFGVAQYFPNGWPLADTSALQAEITAQKQEAAAMKGQIAALATARAAPDESALTSRVAALEAALSQPAVKIDLSPLEARVTELEGRMSAIASVPLGANGAPQTVIAAQDTAIRQIQAQLQTLQASQSGAALSPEAESQIKAAVDAAAAMQADAGKLLKTIEQTAALGRVLAAMDSGAPYTSALPALGEVPPAVADSAATGIPTLSALRASFPQAARAAIEAALRVNMGEGWSDRLANFLRAQTGARSLTPREGADPDAILSRAEAALAAGDVATALGEIAALPEPAQAAMADWRSKAEQRQTVISAVAALAKALGQ